MNQAAYDRLMAANAVLESGAVLTRSALRAVIANAKPAAFPDWQDGEKFADMPINKRFLCRVRLRPSDMAETSRGVERSTVISPFEFDSQHAISEVIRFAEIPAGEPPEIAKPEARLDWQPGEEFKNQRHNEEFLCEVRWEQSITANIEWNPPRFVPLSLRLFCDSRSIAAVIRFARIPLPEGEE
jgi:hypothetical protein